MASIQISTGLVKSLLGSTDAGIVTAGSFASIFGSSSTTAGELRIYGYKTDGTTPVTTGVMSPPATADEALTVAASAAAAVNTLICPLVLTAAGTPGTAMVFAVAACTSNYLDKAASPAWSGVVEEMTTTGHLFVPVFWRLCIGTDDDSASTDFPRVQGDIRADMTGAGVLSLTTLAEGASQTLDIFRIALPLTTA